MTTHPDTLATAVLLERGLLVHQVERQALLLAAAGPRRSARVNLPAPTTAAHHGGLARAIRSLQLIMRLAHAYPAPGHRSPSRRILHPDDHQASRGWNARMGRNPRSLAVHDLRNCIG